jgi:alkylation response protein AidB-like acyl-CoA dehydrogenase
MLRCLARGDSSVALVSAMHPAVLAFWLASPNADGGDQAAWDRQREDVFATAASGNAEGAWWGTITSEPGSGGDASKSNASAKRQPDGTYLLTGQKHFGSGAGMSRYMITTANADDDPSGDAELFYIETRGHKWDGSDGMKIIAEWDGHGMAATQSHAFSFEDMPAVRFAWHGHSEQAMRAAFGFVGCLFAAVIVGICDVAIETARKQLAPKADTMRTFDKVEWARAEIEHWLIQQAYEGMLRAVEGAPPGGTPRGVAQGKMAIAELAETAMSRICKVVGGGTYHRRSPFGHWYEDVRALGFLRPPWGLAYDRLIDSAFI